MRPDNLIEDALGTHVFRTDGRSNSLNKTRMASMQRLILAPACDRVALSISIPSDLIYFVDEGSDPQLINVMPIVAVFVSQQGEVDLAEYVKALGDLRSVPLPPILHLGDPGGPAAMILIELLDKPLRSLANYASNLAGQLAIVRREREQLFENFRRLEDAFNAESLSSSVAIFEYDPFVDHHEDGVGFLLLTESGIEQILPASSNGVCGISLHFKHADAVGHLLVSLEIAETEEIIAEWSLDSKSILPGWNCLMMSRAFDAQARTMRLRLVARGSIPPEPSLGSYVTNPKFTAKSSPDHPDLERRALAFRIFSGVPGIRPVGEINMIATAISSNAPDLVSFRLPAEVLRTVECGIAPDPSVEHATVEYYEHGGRVLCHPRPEGMTVGLFRDAVPIGTLSAYCKAVVDHPDGSPAIVGLFARSHDRPLIEQIAALPDRADMATRVDNFSGWREVTHRDPISLSIDFARGTLEARDLVIISQPKSGHSVDFCWCKLFDFRLTRRIKRFES